MTHAIDIFAMCAGVYSCNNEYPDGAMGDGNGYVSFNATLCFEGGNGRGHGRCYGQGGFFGYGYGDGESHGSGDGDGHGSGNGIEGRW